jgi:hypothetical protein
MSEHEFFETEQLMRGLGKVIDLAIDHKGFVLVVFEFDKPCIANYISNAKRENIIKALREMADKFERNKTIPAIKHKIVQ